MSTLLKQLRASGVVDEQALQAALRRQQIYGGSLDTVLLELDHIDPPTLSKELAAANGCDEVAVALLHPGPERPWNALPKSLLDLGWAMPLRTHMGMTQAAIHPEIPAEQRQQLERAIDRLQLFVTCEACLAKLAAERRGSVMPQRYAVLALKWIQALEREQPAPEPAAPAAPWMTASSDTAPYTVPPPEEPPAPVSAPRIETPPRQPEPEPAPSPDEPEPDEATSGPEPVKRSETYLYGLPVDDDDELPPIEDDDEPAPPPAEDEDIVTPRPLSNRGVEARPSASLGERLAGPRSALEEATTRDGTTEALVRAAMVLSPRVALFGIKREGLRGLASPGEIEGVTDQLVELSPKIDAAIDGSAPLERVTDLDLRIALGQEMAVPCLFLPVKVHERPVLMLYVDRGGEDFSAEEREAGEELCDMAGRTLEDVLRRMREAATAPTKPAPAPTASPAASPAIAKASIFSAASSLMPPSILQGPPAQPVAPPPKPVAPPPKPVAPPPKPVALPPKPVAPPPKPVAPPPKPVAPAVPVPPVRVAPPVPSSAPSVSFAAPGSDKPPVRVPSPPAQPPPTRPGLEVLSAPLGNSVTNPATNPTSSPVAAQDRGSIRGHIQLDDEDRPNRPDAETQGIDAALQAAMRGESSATPRLREIGEPAMQRIAKLFPGELDVHRRDLDTLPPLPAHGALIRVALDIGEALGPHLVELIDHPNPTVRFYVAFVFMELRHPLAIGALGKLAFDPDADVRAIAMRVLETYSGEPGFEDAISVIRRELGSPNRTRQLHSTRAVGTVRDIAAVGKLIELLASKERYIQEASLESLCSITGQQLGLKPHRWRSWYEDNAHHHRVEWIISSLAHKDLSVRRWAADELRRITGQRIHFLAAGTKQEREIGIRKWVDWWNQRGRQEFEF